MKKIKILYTDIGRGHPFYLDGVIEELNRNGGIDSIHSKSTAFDHANNISLFMWNLVKYLYIQGGKENLVSRLYKRIRKNNDYNKSSLGLTLLGRDIQKIFLQDNSPLLIAHPILIAILKNRSNLYYQHGELISPQEAVVKGAKKIFVPIESASIPFFNHYAKEDIIITGLCIEPSIESIAKDAFDDRLKRFTSNENLTGCFISSGAEPTKHIQIIIEALLSHLKASGKAILFVKKDGRLDEKIKTVLQNENNNFIIFDSLDSIPYELPPLTVMQFSNRRDENRFTSHFFKEFDFFVSPSHERSNWAVGLGLPMFITEPSIGPFSSLNREFLLKSNTATQIKTISESKKFAFKLKELHISGNLEQMSLNGWGKYRIDGFRNIVSYLKNIS